MQQKIILILAHITGRVPFLTLPLFFLPGQSRETGLHTGSLIFNHFFVLNAFLIGFFYLDDYILIPVYTSIKKYLVFLDIRMLKKQAA